MIEPDVKRSLDSLRQGFVTSAGSFTLAASPATTTVVTRLGVNSTSVIVCQAANAATSNSDIARIIPATDQFTVHHSNATATRVFRYAWFTNAG